jgi:chromosomal replication initiation ATPase DnaA
MTTQAFQSIRDNISLAATPYLPTGTSLDFQIVSNRPETLLSQREIANKIQELTCHFFGLTTSQVLTRNRKHNLSECRKAICLMVRRYTRIKLMDISALAFYTPNHSSVIRAIEALEDWIKYDRDEEIKIANLSYYLLSNINLYKHDN